MNTNTLPKAQHCTTMAEVRQHIVERVDMAAHLTHGAAVLCVVDRARHSRPSSTSLAARSRARALCSVSFHSISGTESATIPAAACT